MKTTGKRKYVKPEVNVFDCQCRNSLLAGSAKLILDNENEFIFEDATGQTAY